MRNLYTLSIPVKPGYTMVFPGFDEGVMHYMLEGLTWSELSHVIDTVDTRWLSPIVVDCVNGDDTNAVAMDNPDTWCQLHESTREYLRKLEHDLMQGDDYRSRGELVFLLNSSHMYYDDACYLRRVINLIVRNGPKHDVYLVLITNDREAMSRVLSLDDYRALNVVSVKRTKNQSRIVIYKEER